MNRVAATAFSPGRATPLDAFVADSLRRVSMAYVCWLGVAATAAWLIYYATRAMTAHAIGPALVLYYVVLALHVLRRLRHGGSANILRPDILFVLLYSMFHVGYVTLYAVGIAPHSTEIFRFDQFIPAAMFVTNLGLIGFLLGYEVAGAASSQAATPPTVRIPTDSWLIVGLGVIIAALGMHLGAILFIGPDIFQRYGYSAVQNVSQYTGYLPALMLSQSVPVLLIGMVTYMTASVLRYQKLFHSKFALMLIVGFLILFVLEGDRGPLLKLGLPLLLGRHCFVRRVRLRFLVLLFVGTLALFATIRVVRTIAFEPATMWREYQYQRQAGFLAWTDPFIEMGASFSVINVTCHAVPGQEPYWRGASWASAALHIVPFLQQFAVRNEWLPNSPSAWVTETYWGTKRAGRGFLVSAEGYLNFGFPGALVEVMGFGLFIRWLTIWFSRAPSGARLVVMFACLVPAVMVIRNHLNIVTSDCVQVLVAGILLRTVLGYESARPALSPERLLTSRLGQRAQGTVASGV